MSTIDENVVSMRFDNKEFERNAQQSLGTLDKLKKALHFDKTGESLKKLGDEAKQVDFSKMSGQLDAMEKRFSTFGIAGAAAISRVTNAAMDLGKTLIKDVAKPFTAAVQQIKSGGISRAMNLEHAHFQLMGLVNDEQKVAEILNGPVQQAVDGTAYGLDAAAVAASSLVASGVQTQELLGPLKAIAGVAAMTGREYSDIADIFTTVASNGKLMTMQLRQLSASGLNASAALAKAMNKSEAEINEMVTQGKISFADFSKAMEEAFGDHAAEANKTFTGALSNVKAALSRIGAKVVTPGLDHLRDVFNELRPKINEFNQVLGDDKSKGTAIYHIVNMSKRFSDLAQELLKSEGFTRFVHRAANGLGMLFEKIDGLTARFGPMAQAFKGLGNIFKALYSYVEPVVKAFLDIFPPTTMRNLTMAANHFKEFTERLKASDRVANNIRRTFRGVFSVIKAVGSIGRMVVNIIFNIVKQLTPAGRMLTDVFGTLGDILSDVSYYITLAKTAIEYTLQYFNVFEAVGGTIGKVLGSIIRLVDSIAKLIGGVFVGLANSLLSIFGITLPPIESAADVIGLVMQGIVVAISLVLSVVDAVADGFYKLASVFTGGADYLSKFNIEIDKTNVLFRLLLIPINAVKIVIEALFNALYNVMNYIAESGGLFGAIERAFAGLGEAFEKFYNFINDHFGGIFDKIGSGFEFVASKVKEYTQNMTLGKIATAAFIGLMIGMGVQIAKLIGGVSSITYGLGRMANQTANIIEAFKWRLRPTLIQRFSKVLHEFAYAVLALTAALVIIASTPNVDDAMIKLGIMAATLVGMTAILFVLSKAMAKAKIEKQLMELAFTMIAIGASLLVLVGALKMLDGINTDGIIAKAAAIGIMAVGLGAAAGVMSKIAPRMTKGAFGLIAFAFSVKQIVSAMKDIAASELVNINQALPILIAIMGGMALLAVAMGSVKLSSGLGILLVAAAIKILLPVIESLIQEASRIDFTPLTQFVEKFKYELLILGGLAALAAVVIKKLSEGFRNFAIGMLGVVTSIYLLVKIANIAGKMKPEELKRGVLTIAAFMGMIALLMALSKLTGGAKMIQFAASLAMISMVITALIGLSWLIGQMDPGTLIKGMAVIGLYIGFMAVLMLASKATEKAHPSKIAFMFLSMAGAVAALTTCMYIIGNMDLGIILKGGLVVTAMIAVLAGFMMLAKSVDKLPGTKLAAMFASLAGAILLMTYCIKLLGEMPLGTLLKGSITVTALLLLVTFITKSLSKVPEMSKMTKILAPVVGVIAMLGAVILAMKAVAEMPVSDILKGGITVAAALLFMTAMAKSLAKMPDMAKARKILAPVLSVIGMLATIIVAIVMISEMEVGDIVKSLLTITAGLAVLVGVIKLVAGTPVNDAGWKAMLAGCAMMYVVALAIGKIADFNWGSLLAAAVAMSTCVVAVALILKNVVSLMNIDWKQIGQFAVGLAALYLVAMALDKVAEGNDWKAILAAAGGIGACVAAFVLLFEMFNAINIEWSQIGKFALGLATLYIVAMAMSKVLEASQDWKAIMAAATGLSLAAGSIAVVMIFMDKFVKEFNPAAIGTFAVAVAGLLGVALALQMIISAGDYQAIVAAGDALLKAVVAIGLVLVELAAAALLGAAVIAGAPMMLAALGAVTLIVMAMGALYKIPFVKELIEGGGELLGALGGAIGKFFGGIVDGFASLAGNAIVTVGHSLADFANVSKPFWDMLKSFEGTGIIQSAKDMVGVVLVLTAAAFLNQITDFFSWVTGGDGGFVDLAKNLIIFGIGMAKFQDVTQNVSPERINKVAESAKALGGVLAVLNEQKSGGIFEVFTGTTDFVGAIKGLVGYGEAMAKLTGQMKGINDGQLDRLVKCAQATNDLVQAMPEKHGAIKGLFSSYKDIAGSAKDMESWAKSMLAISDVFHSNYIDHAAIESAVNSAKLIAGLAENMPEENGALKWLVSSEKKDLDTFGEELVPFGKSIVEFSDVIKGRVDKDAIEAAANAADMMATLANKMPEENGWISGLFSDEKKDLDDFGEELAPFATGLVDFSKKLGEMDEEAITKFEPTLQSLSNIMSSVSNLKDSELEAFGNTFEHLGEALKEFGQNSDEIDTDKVSAFSLVLDDLLEVFNKKFGQGAKNFKGMTEFTKSINAINDSLKMVTSDRQDEMKEFGNTLETFSQQYVAFIKGENGVRDVDTADVKKFVEQIKMLESAVATKGKKVDSSRFAEFTTFANGLGKVVEAITKLTSGEADVEKAKGAITDLTKSMSKFINGINKIGKGDIKKAKGKLNDISKMLNSFVGKKINTEGLKSVTGQIKNALTDMTKAMDVVKTKMDATYYNQIETYASNVVIHFANGLSGKKNDKVISTACNTLLNSFANKLDINTGGKKYKSNFTTCANHIINGFKVGLTSSTNMVGVYETGKKIYEKLDQGIRDAGQVKSPSRRTMEIGKYTVQGLLIGIKKHSKGIYASGYKMGDDVMDGINTRLGIHSPATALIAAAKNVVAGWLKGAKGGAGKIFESGNSFGGNFIKGLKGALDKIKKGKFSGGSLLDSFKKNLDLDKFKVDNKDTTNISKGIGKAMETAANKPDAKKGARGAGKTSGKEAAKAFEKEFLAGVTSAINAIGSRIKPKDLAKALGDSSKAGIKAAKEYLKLYEKYINTLSQDSNVRNASMTNTAAMLKFSKNYKKQVKYIEKLSKELNVHVLDGVAVASKKSLEKVGLSLAKQTSEYKTAEKNYNTYTKNLASYSSKAAKKLNDLRKLREKYDKTSNKKTKKSLAKQIKSTEKSLQKIESKVVDLRKKAADEMGKMSAATVKALKEVRKATNDMVKGWLDFKSFSVDGAGIIKGFDSISESFDNATSSLDLFDAALNKTTESASDAEKAYDGLSAAMDTGMNLFDRFTKTGSVEADALFENADSQLEAFEEFQNGIAELEKKGLDAALVDQLASEGPEALSKIRGFLSMSADQIQSYNERLEKQHEYEAKVLERSLRRQFEQYEAYYADLLRLQARFGSNFADNPVYNAIASSGMDSANYISALLKMSADSFSQSTKYFQAGMDNTIAKALSNSGNSTEVATGADTMSRTIWGKLADNLEKSSKEKSDFEEAYAKAIDVYGLDASLASALYDKGAETAKPYFDGLANATEEEIKRVNEAWLKTQRKETTGMLSQVASQLKRDISSQDNVLESIAIDSNSGFITLLSKFKEQFITKMQESESMNYAEALEAWNAGAYENAFTGLVQQLKDSGQSSKDIFAALNQWINDEDKGWANLKGILEDFNTRTTNTAKITGESVKESWRNTIETTKRNAKQMGQLVQKFGSSMSKELYDYLQELDPEQIAALNELSPEELKSMADDFYDANQAAEYISDNIFNSYINGYTEGMKRFRSAISGWNGKDTGDPTQNASLELGSWIQEQRAQGKSLKEIIDEYKGLKGDAFKEVFKISSGDKEAKKTIKDTMKWLSNALVEMSDKTDEEIIGLLANGAITQGNNILQFVGEAMQSGDNLFSMVADTFGTGFKSVLETVGAEIQNPEYSESISKSMGTSIQNGIVKGTQLSEENVKKCSANIRKALKKVSDNATADSKAAFKANGQKLGEKEASGVKKGLTDSEGTIITTLKSVAKKVTNSTKSTYKNYGEELGTNMVDGLAIGIRNGQSRAISAAVAVAVAAYQAAKAAIDSNSPSKKFMQLGEWSSEGFAIGIQNGADQVTTSVTDMAKSTLTGMKEAISTINDVINGDLELSPVITPQLDLSLLNRQVQSTGQLFDAKVRFAQEQTEQNATNQNGGVNQTFVQNNYSPKALSREEIYRQTKNQFAMARKVVNGNAQINYGY